MRRVAALLVGLLVVVGLVGCVSSAPKELTIDITIAKGQVTPNGQRVEVAKDGTVTINVTSDAADEVHVHGYDREIEVTPGEPAQLRFTADQVGVFEVESHGSGKLIVSLAVK